MSVATLALRYSRTIALLTAALCVSGVIAARALPSGIYPPLQFPRIVIVAHSGRVEQLREVVVDPASQTSVNLLRCLLGERGMKVEFVSQGDIRAERGLLLIGDQAIRFRQQSRGRHQFLDLGAEWKKATGKPFVYALWLVRPDCDGKLAVAQALRSLGQNNVENLRALIAAQPASIREFCEFYFRECLRFAFDEEEKRGFQMFGELCVKQELLPAVPPTPKLI